MDKTRVLGTWVCFDSDTRGELQLWLWSSENQLDYSNDDRIADFN